MAREAFSAIGHKPKKLALIGQANTIIDQYRWLGFTLTLRQLFYQLVARGWIANTPDEYDRLGIAIKDGRRTGLVDWSMIEDRTREVQRLYSWGSPAEAVMGVAETYREDLWLSQQRRPEVWIEKDALLGVIEGACEAFPAPYFACRGNASESALYEAAKRFGDQISEGLTPIVLHLGDHDPNGLDMTRDNRDRLAMFARQDIDVRRIALNMDQVQLYSPPPNFAKPNDPNYKKYVAQFGRDCWELDALDPTVIDNLIRTELTALIDWDAWNLSKSKEDENRAALVDMAQGVA